MSLPGANISERKASLDDWVMFGGAPAFREPLHVGCPNIGDRDRLMARFACMLDRRWLSNDGPFARELEQRIAARLGVRHCIAMANGTIALEIAIRALEVTGEVLVPSFTFIATAHALQWQRITPVFCEIDPATHALDPEGLEPHITPRTAAILGVHVWGEPCAIESLTEIARRRGLKLIFDASHAFDCSHRGRMIGGFGDAEVFSFHATKYFNTFEGGAVTTDNDELAGRLALMRNFGFSGYDNVIHIGTNGKMSEVSAAMGLTGLESLDEFKACNRRNYECYRDLLCGIGGLRLFRVEEREERNYQYVVVEVDESQTGIGRDLLVRLLHAENVLARRYFYPGCHRMEPYRTLFPDAGVALPATEALCERTLILPTGTIVGDREINIICGLMVSAVEQATDIRRRAVQ